MIKNKKEKSRSVNLKETGKREQRSDLLHRRSLYQASEKIEEAVQTAGQRRIEKEFLGYIALGNIALARQFIHTASENGQFILDIGSMSENDLQQARFAVVASITLFCRTALDCGLPETLAYSISDVYIQYLSNTKEEENIYQLFVQAFLEYCQAVQDWRLSGCSPVLRTCCEYIMSHLHSRITMEELGRVCALSPNYVSDLFKKELNIRPIAYIRQKKMNYAAYLLQHSSLSVAEISELLALPSSSSFASQFTEQYGMTPYRYRKQLSLSPDPTVSR